ncbi:hypothetical protein [Armatimonas sp.]|uniref:PGAP1-like alpha/beta domain-containing protein n=1 Tax=Armatimonas sp. TaxID=1872638 RepID=UPI003751631A
MKTLNPLLPMAYSAIIALPLFLAPAVAQNAVLQNPTIQNNLPQLGLEPKSFAFSPNRPRLVVLLHGVTNPRENSPEEGIGTSTHARFYWGYDFIRALMGVPTNPAIQLIQRGKTRTDLAFIQADNWTVTPKDSLDALKSEDGDLAPVLVPDLMFKRSEGRVSADDFKAEPNPKTAVMVTFRDGSEHLMPQLGDAIDQIFSTYRQTFGHLPEASQPQIYLMGHSFGGVVARAILTNPEGSDLYGGRLNSGQRQRADYLRRRVVNVTTISAPHTGTIIPEMTTDVDRILKTGQSLLPSTASLKKQGPLEKIKSAIVDSGVGKLHDALDKAIKSASGNRDSLHDILRMAEYNKGILSPEKATRVDGSLVPIFTLGGRNPGGMFFDRNRAPFIGGGRVLPHTLIDVMGAGRFPSNGGSLYLIESLLHRAGYGKANGKPWGAAMIPEADIMSSPMRGITSSLTTTQLSNKWQTTSSLPMIAGVLADGFTANPYALGSDGENDTDGFCGFDSSHGLAVAPTKPYWWKGLYGARYGSLMPWDQDNHGSLMFNVGNGLYLYNEMLCKAGPIPAANSDLGLWTPSTSNNLAKHNIKIDIARVWSRDGKIDPQTGREKTKLGDFDVSVRVAGNLKKFACKEDAKSTTYVGFHEISNTPQSVIPIVISVIDRDRELPNDPDDDCVLSPEKGRDNLYLYFDTRTGRIYGDATGKAGEEITVGGYKGAYNPVGVAFKITGN